MACRVFDHQTYINDALWDGDERITFWAQKVKVKITVEYSMLEKALLAFTTLSDHLASSYIHLRFIYVVHFFQS